MRTALIGYSGFVGSNLAAAHAFTDLYNTANITDIRRRSYDLVVTAAGRADSHRINEHAAEDLADLDRLIDVLSTVRTERLVLVSTVCVYPGGTSPDEATPTSAAGLLPYGANRLHMERALSEAFRTLVLRLPHLYGIGLKKGIVHDLLNDYRVEHIHPDGRFQYYDLRRLWGDTQVALDSGLTSLNVATPPLTSARVAEQCFAVDLPGRRLPGEGPPLVEWYTRDMRTRHADLFGGPPGFLMDEAAELAALDDFVREVRAARTAAGAPR